MDNRRMQYIEEGSGEQNMSTRINRPQLQQRANQSRSPPPTRGRNQSSRPSMFGGMGTLLFPVPIRRNTGRTLKKSKNRAMSPTRMETDQQWVSQAFGFLQNTWKLPEGFSVEFLLASQKARKPMKRQSGLKNAVRRSLRLSRSKPKNGQHAELMTTLQESVLDGIDQLQVVDLHAMGNHLVFLTADNQICESVSGEAPAQREFELPGSEKIVQVRCGAKHIVALTSGGSVFLSRDSSSDFQMLRNPRDEPIVQIACTASSTVLLGHSGRVFVHGKGLNGELGLGETEKEVDDIHMRQVGGQLKTVAVKSIDAGPHHCLAVSARGNLYGWGSNVNNQLTQHQSQKAIAWPFLVRSCDEDSTVVVQAFAGEDYTCFLCQEGKLGRIGGTSPHLLEPRSCRADDPPVQVSEMDGKLYVLTRQGRVLCLNPDVGDQEELSVGSETKHPVRLVVATGRLCCLSESIKGGSEAFVRLSTCSPPVYRVSPTDLFKQASACQDNPTDVDEVAELARIVLQVCSDPYVFMQSFVQVNPVGSRSGLALEETIWALKKAIKTVSTLSPKKEEFLRRLKTEVGFLLETLISCAKSVSVDDQVFMFFAVLATPLLSLCDLDLICEYAMSLRQFPRRQQKKESSTSSTMYNRLFEWIARDATSESMSSFIVPVLVKCLEREIEPVVLNGGIDLGGASENAAGLSAMLRRLYQINSARFRKYLVQDHSRLGFQPISPELFGTRVLLRLLEISPDLVVSYMFHWQHSRTRKNKTFSLFNYPELLSPDTKSTLLRMESNHVKLRRIQHEQQASAGTGESPWLVLPVKRESILKDTLDALKQLGPMDLRLPLVVEFDGEEGLDAGGVKKEFFQLLSKELFDPEVMGLFWEREDGKLWFVDLEATEEVGSLFVFVGQVIALALFNSTILDVDFPLTVYRFLLGKMNDKEMEPIDILAEFDQELAKSMLLVLQYKEDDIEDAFGLTFESGGVPLKENGANIAVTQSNKEEFVKLYTEHSIFHGVKPHLEKLLEGFSSVVDPNFAVLPLFTPRELSLATTGSLIIDIELIKRNTRYEGGYHAGHPTVVAFWRVLRRWPANLHQEFLRFTTGAPRPPMSGLYLTIQRNGRDSDSLPSASTCFNVLLLPDYASETKLEEKLRFALENGKGFYLK